MQGTQDVLYKLHTTDEHQKIIYDELVEAVRNDKLTVMFQDEIYPVDMLSLSGNESTSGAVRKFMEKHNLNCCAVLHFGSFASPASITDYDDGKEIE